MRGEKKHHGFGGLVHAESGLALECKVRKCGVPHILVGKSDCAIFAHNTEAQGQLPRRPDVLPGARGRHFASEVSYCIERSKEDQRAEMTMSIKHPHAGEIVWHQQILAGKCISPAAKAPIRAPRPAEDLQITRPLSCCTAHQNRLLAEPITMAGAGVR